MKSLTWKRTTSWYRTLQDVWSRWTWTKKSMNPELNLHYPARTYHFFHHNLHHSSCASCPAAQSGANWLIARASYVRRREPAAGVAKGGYGREGGGYSKVGFFHWWLSSWPGLDTHIPPWAGPYLKLQCALVMRFKTNSPHHSTSMQKDLNRLIWRERHAVFKLGATHTYVRSRICVSWDRPPDSPSSSSPTVIFQHQAQSEIPKNNPSFQKISTTQFRCVVTASSGGVVSSSVFGVLDGHVEIQ